MKMTILVTMLAVLFVGCIRLPDGLHVYESTNGCSSQGVCPWTDGQPKNWYDAASREVVVAPNQSLKVWAHEACHAHQHQTILDETGQEPVQVSSSFNPAVRIADLHEWVATSEGVAYAAVVEQAGANGWGAHYAPLLEDFAEACGRYMVGRELDPVRAAFFTARDFK